MDLYGFWMDLYHFCLIVLGFALGFVVGMGVGRHSLLRQLFKDLRSGGNGWKVLKRWKS